MLGHFKQVFILPLMTGSPIPFQRLRFRFSRFSDQELGWTQLVHLSTYPMQINQPRQRNKTSLDNDQHVIYHSQWLATLSEEQILGILCESGRASRAAPSGFQSMKILAMVLHFMALQSKSLIALCAV